MARAIVARNDTDPERRGLERARQTCARWLRSAPAPALEEWSRLLSGDWAGIRSKSPDAGLPWDYYACTVAAQRCNAWIFKDGFEGGDSGLW